MTLVSLRILKCVVLSFFLGITTAQAHATERWSLYEVELTGPRDGNPFANVVFSAEFRHGDHEVHVDGFYDGDGVYRIRFMPDVVGQWSYTTHSNRIELGGKTSQFTCTAATRGNHGPVRVGDNCLFVYADGARYPCFGTTCYAWIHQPQSLRDQTLHTPESAPFNKLRMCIFPKNYAYNKNEPERFPFGKKEGGGFDLRRFDPAFWRNLDHRIAQLRDLGIEADLILFHPYDEGRWGFDRMDAESDDFYLRYAIARLAAYRNVWRSLANEYDFMKHKSLADWDRFFGILQQRDPYKRLRSIHNGSKWYDHAKPWVTHASVQSSDMANGARLRERYHKPVVYDECCYEGNIEWLWGNLTPEQMTHRFWDGLMRGCYVGHGETYLDPKDILWWSKGGVLHGTSAPRIAFLRRIVEEAPAQIAPIADMFGWEQTVIGVTGVRDQFYLIYFGGHRPARKELPLAENGRFTIEVIDTWNMTVERLSGTYSGKRRIDLPVRPYVALRVKRESGGTPK